MRVFQAIHIGPATTNSIRKKNTLRAYHPTISKFGHHFGDHSSLPLRSVTHFPSHSIS